MKFKCTELNTRKWASAADLECWKEHCCSLMMTIKTRESNRTVTFLDPIRGLRARELKDSEFQGGRGSVDCFTWRGTIVGVR